MPQHDAPIPNTSAMDKMAAAIAAEANKLIGDLAKAHEDQAIRIYLHTMVPVLLLKHVIKAQPDETLTPFAKMVQAEIMQSIASRLC